MTTPVQVANELMEKVKLDIELKHFPTKHLIGTAWLGIFCIAVDVNKAANPDDFDVEVGTDILRKNLYNKSMDFLVQNVAFNSTSI